MSKCQRRGCSTPKDTASPLFLCQEHQGMFDRREIGYDPESHRLSPKPPPEINVYIGGTLPICAGKEGDVLYDTVTKAITKEEHCRENQTPNS